VLKNSVNNLTKLTDFFMWSLKAQRRISANTQAAYAQDLSVFVEFYKNWRADEMVEISNEILEKFFDFLRQKGASDSTIARRMATIAQFLEFCLDEKLARMAEFTKPSQGSSGPSKMAEFTKPSQGSSGPSKMAEFTKPSGSPDQAAIASQESPNTAKMAGNIGMICVENCDKNRHVGNKNACENFGKKYVFDKPKFRLNPLFSPFFELSDLEKMRGILDENSPSDLRLRAIIEVLYSTGLRISELLALKKSDLSAIFGHQALVVRGKGGHERVVFFSEISLEFLKKYVDMFFDSVAKSEGQTIKNGQNGGFYENKPLKKHKTCQVDKENSYLFFSTFGLKTSNLKNPQKNFQQNRGENPVENPQKNPQKISDEISEEKSSKILKSAKNVNKNKPLTRQRVFQLLKNLAIRAELDPDTVFAHAFRHRLLTDLVLNGADLVSVQKIAGHQQIQTTARYTHVEDELFDHLSKFHPLSKNKNQENLSKTENFANRSNCISGKIDSSEKKD